MPIAVSRPCGVTTTSGAIDRIVAEWYEANRAWAEARGIGPPPPRV